jgi:hypothetical protein
MRTVVKKTEASHAFAPLLKRHGIPLGLFFLFSIAATYPLILDLSRQLPHDLGDPLLNVWIIDHGQAKLLSNPLDFFETNIFYPYHRTLAYSENLFALALLSVPLRRIGLNAVAAYNVLFILSYILCGFGAYLLLYYLTGSRLAGFIAGVAYAFSSFRVLQVGHIHMLATQWIPFLFLYLHKFFREGGLKQLGLLTLFYLLQCLSSMNVGVFITPFLILAMGFFIVRQRRWDLWWKIIAFWLVSAMILCPFVLPYFQVHTEMGFERTRWDQISFSADLGGLLTAPAEVNFWGKILRIYPKPEGDLFPGFLIPLLIFLPLAQKRKEKKRWVSLSSLRKGLIACLLIVALLALAASVFVSFGGGFKGTILGFHISLQKFRNPNTILLASAVILFVAEGRMLSAVRQRLQGAGSHMPLYLVGGFLAMLLALGPYIQWGGKIIAYGPYYLFFRFVPAFQGFRVPARMACPASFFLCVAAGHGVFFLLRRFSRRIRIALSTVLVLLFLLENLSWPLQVNWQPPRMAESKNFSGIHLETELPAVYRWLMRDGPEGPILELPMIVMWSEVQYMYYSTFHGRRLVNGYSGFFPPLYNLLRERTKGFPDDETLRILRENRVRTVLIHPELMQKKEWSHMRGRMRLMDHEFASITKVGDSWVLRLNP